MILPDDILKEISAFSKPIFRYFREYNAMLRELGKPVWPELKEKLTGTDADKASVLIQQYVNTAESARYLEQTYYKTKQHLTMDQQSNLREDIRTAEWRQYGFHRDLSILINGKMDWNDLNIHLRHRPYDEDEPN